MRLLIISDIHNRIKWIESNLKEHKEKHKWDKVIFLGDYFDDYGDTMNPWVAIAKAKNTATWLKHSLTQTDRIHLLGNHDMPYIVGATSFLNCPGFTPDKYRAIRGVLTEEDRYKLAPAHTDNGWVFSHAGFQKEIVEHPINGIPSNEGLVTLAETALAELRLGYEPILFRQGKRMGKNQMGGITWCDWDMEFQPLSGVKQVVGHTYGSQLKTAKKTDDNDLSICIDNGNAISLIVKEDGAPYIISNKLND